jgi:hypothetical protein
VPPAGVAISTSNIDIVPGQGGFSADTRTLNQLPGRWIQG